MSFIKKLFGSKPDEVKLAESVKTPKAPRAKAKPKAKVETVVEEKPKAKTKAKKLTNSSKDIATKNKEPWVSVLDTHVNSDNPANGFFELDWNDYFIVLLKGHGYDGPTEESIIEAWFQNLCRNIGNEEGMDMDRRGSGYINVQKIADGKAEIS